MGRRKIEKPEVEVMNIVPFAPTLPLSKTSLDAASEQRTLLKEFIQKQMREGVDYGVIPGTKLPTLFKPGAEKLAKLFNLTIGKEQTDKVIERHENFAMFTYRATVRHGGVDIAQCEGSCNSQEKKYKERKSFRSGSEETPIFDILNTLQKMAQKRAMVGAVIEAVGASDFYTQDIEDAEDAEALGIRSHVQAKVVIPTVTNATSSLAQAELCDSCSQPMMISIYGKEPRPFYCSRCKITKPRE